LRFLQARNPDWVHRPFFAEYNDQAVWLNELKPAFGKDRFFFEDELDRIYHENFGRGTADNFE
ncbi:MAG TPA: lysine 2,3-aminomutase, partial [Desulfobacteraceae bacterium]|nr:lysine 2,3-aminomutase [Desulfobacteraceae bacterium]